MTLTEAGFDATSPTAWLAEGLFLYLTAGAASQLLLHGDLSYVRVMEQVEILDVQAERLRRL